MKRIISILSIFTIAFCLGCDSDSGTENGNGDPDAQVNPDQGTPPEDSSLPPDDQHVGNDNSVEPDNSTPDPLEDFMFLQRSWEFMEGGNYDGSPIRSVQIKPPSSEYDAWGFGDYDAVAVGLFPEGLPYPLKKVSETIIEIDFGDGFASRYASIEIGSDKIEIEYTDPSTEFVDKYKGL